MTKMVETTFTSIHYVEPSGSGPVKKVRFGIADRFKFKEQFETTEEELVQEGEKLLKFRKFDELVKESAIEATRNFHVDTEAIDLHQEEIVDIDLSQMAEFPKLKTLVLGYNPFMFVDFTPLSKCYQLKDLLLDKCSLLEIDLSFAASNPNFRLITLRGTPISRINLTPLQKCPKYKVLDMEWNQLRHIDLSPLSACKKLEFLALQHNHLEEVDLTPLAECRHLEVLYLHGNKYETLDVRPLVRCKKLEDCRVDPVKIVKMPKGQKNICEMTNELDDIEDDSVEN